MGADYVLEKLPDVSGPSLVVCELCLFKVGFQKWLLSICQGQILKLYNFDQLRLSNDMCLSMFSVTMLLPCFLCVMLCPLHFHVFMHLHLACHIGTLDDSREGRDGGSSRRWID